MNITLLKPPELHIRKSVFENVIIDFNVLLESSPIMRREGGISLIAQKNMLSSRHTLLSADSAILTLRLLERIWANIKAFVVLKPSETTSNFSRLRPLACNKVSILSVRSKGLKYGRLPESTDPTMRLYSDSLV